MGISLDETSKADKAYVKLRETLEKSMNKEELEEIDSAYEWARAAHSGQLRYSGQPYIIHPIAVAQILADYGMDKGSIIAALLHDIVEDTDATLDDVKKKYGQEIASIVDGLTKLTKAAKNPVKEKAESKQQAQQTQNEEIPQEKEEPSLLAEIKPIDFFNAKEVQQAENVRKMLLAMSQDIRVIIIKLADRIHNMRTLSFMRPPKRREKALETLEIFAPIAHRLGIRTMKEELEDLSISYLDPIGYNDIQVKLAKQQKERTAYLERIKQEIDEKIKDIVPEYTISGRIKSVHGIYRKMYIQNKSFDEIYDIYAVRIIVNTVTECYQCFGMIHEMYSPIPNRIKDYIAMKKPNNYQSLHTTVIGKDGIPFEVQIRTKEMHQTAEYGIAAHWKYKAGITKGKQQSLDDKLAWIRQLLEEQNETGNPEDIVRTIKDDFIPEEVFVFTPKGDVVNLPVGSTIVDFAYGIHSAVGHKMMAAKVDGRIVPLDHQVKTGEIIEIITSSQPGKGPSRDWLNIARTSSARAKIRAWYKKEKRDENIIEGKLIVEREFRKAKIRLTDEQKDKFILSIAAKQRLSSLDDFYAALGYGGISLSKLLPNIKDEYNKLIKAIEQQENPESVTVASVPTKKIKSDGVIIEGIENCLVKYSRCCNPLPGDEIIGYITRGYGVSIHNRNCPNVPAVIENSPEPERWIKASWDSEKVSSTFKSNLTVMCINRRAMLLDITTQLDMMRVDLISLNANNTKDGNAIFHMVVSVEGIAHLNKVIEKLRKINGVFDVSRSNI
ncbi:MAG: bifunctional (p)ppGpp synthetase/guanosine-3',5'-bis(diphosphate) 3'-pyrophosphohydrolase [Clostridia bacterium]|nr:bifunctional (p)ppGpp synthetase/guanosine-3',5'-bis(diphosphate) 3'-pyrophosphohydrolase [Clostridia bacterium]